MAQIKIWLQKIILFAHFIEILSGCKILNLELFPRTNQQLHPLLSLHSEQLLTVQQPLFPVCFHLSVHGTFPCSSFKGIFFIYVYLKMNETVQKDLKFHVSWHFGEILILKTHIFTHLGITVHFLQQMVLSSLVLFFHYLITAFYYTKMFLFFVTSRTSLSLYTKKRSMSVSCLYLKPKSEGVLYVYPKLLEHLK